MPFLKACNTMNFIPKNNRSRLAIKNIGASILIKGASILISFYLVPLTLGYLNQYEYGVWLTLSSILSWVYLLDIGLGNGLRNKLTEAIADNDMHLGKIYVSTTMFFMFIIVLVFYCAFLIAQKWLDWYSILNVDRSSIKNLNHIVTIVFAFVCIGFLFKIIGNIYMAYQKSAVNDLLALLGNLFSLIVIFICTKITDGSLFTVALIFSSIPALVYLVMLPVTFIIYPQIAPSLKTIKVRHFHSLISLGAKFMIVQIACVIIFMTSNLIISQLLGPEEVTPYNIANKLFSATTMAFTIIITPFWSAITDAYVKGENDWIIKTVKRLRTIWLVVSVLTILIVSFTPYIYQLWVGPDIHITYALSLLCAIYAIVQNWNNIFAYAINATGKLLVSLILAISQALLYIPLAVFLGKILGIYGIVIALCSVLLLSSIILPIQYNMIFRAKAKGVWDK